MIYKVKTLILNGSARADGHTAALLNCTLSQARGEVIFFNAFEGGFSTCSGCAGCTNGVCVINDKMSIVYECAENADNIILASPIYFGSLTPPLLSVLSRFQPFFRGGYHKIPAKGKRKRGVIILTGGGSGVTGRAEADARLMLKIMNAEIIATVSSLNTNILAAKDHEDALKDALAAGKELFGK